MRATNHTVKFYWAWRFPDDLYFIRNDKVIRLGPKSERSDCKYSKGETLTVWEPINITKDNEGYGFVEIGSL